MRLTSSIGSPLAGECATGMRNERLQTRFLRQRLSTEVSAKRGTSAAEGPRLGAGFKFENDFGFRQGRRAVERQSRRMRPRGGRAFGFYDSSSSQSSVEKFRKRRQPTGGEGTTKMGLW
jgi:hypothetical protein